MSVPTCGNVVCWLREFYQLKRAKVLFNPFNKANADSLLYCALGNTQCSLLVQSILHSDSDSD